MKLLEKIILILIFLMFIQFVYAQNCNDPDGGLDYSKQSRVTSDYGEYSDECIDSKLLIEAYCTDDNLNLTVYECPYECKDGACVSSVTTTTITTPSGGEVTTTTSSVTTTTMVVEECSLDNVTIDTSFCTGMDGTCCQGNMIKATAKISGSCPSEAYLQVDLFGDTGCQIFDDLPIGRDCIGLSDIDGLSFNVDCSGDTCTGSTQLPSGIYVIPVPICVGVTVNPVDAGLYKDGFPCEGDNPVSYYNAWTNLVYGSITFGTNSQCSATITTTSTISTVSTTITQTTTSSSVSTTTTTLSTSSIDTLQTNEKCDSCSDGCVIECNHIKRRTFTPYDDKDFFKFTLDRRMKVRIRLNSTNDVNKKLFGDYDLYVKWNGSCPDINPYYCLDGCPECSKANCCDSRTGNYDCGPCSESIDELNNMNEFCPEEGERILESGTYYFMVYNFVGNVPYDVNLICSNIIETTTTILENTGPGRGRTFTSTPSYTTTTFPRETVTTHQEYTTTTEEYTTTTEADKSEGKTPMTNVITKNYILIIATILSLILLVLGIYKIIGKRTEPKPDYTESEYTEENVEQPLY